jgi:16S rRNA (uracil1498-N3)-methyltransferase
LTIDSKGRLELPSEELHHLVRVRRAQEGHKFLGLSARGQWFLCRLVKTDTGWSCDVLQEVLEDRESRLQIRLAQALIKRDRFEWVLQKSVELGVAEIIPIRAKRCEVRISAKKEEQKRGRWTRILRESVKQCGRTRIPKLSRITAVPDLARELPESLRLFLDESGGRSMKSVLAGPSHPSVCTLFVGPEGGWDEEEREAFQQNQIAPIYLGPRILRSETAPLAAISILQYELGDLA